MPWACEDKDYAGKMVIGIEMQGKRGRPKRRWFASVKARTPITFCPNVQHIYLLTLQACPRKLEGISEPKQIAAETSPQSTANVHERIELNIKS